MDIKDLKPGDILLFSGEKGSWISEAIMLLTNSPVSHAALVTADNTKIVEETPPAVQVNPAESRFKDRTIYVNRLKAASTSLTPVLEAAQGYVNDEEPYAMSNLYLVGLLLIYRRFTPSTLTQKIIIKILKRLTARIIEHINARKTPGKLPMVCSQFVFQCFEDAGGDYRLDLRHPILLMKTEAPAEPSILDQTIRQVRQKRSPEAIKMLATSVTAEVADAPDESDEDLAAQLLEALRSEAAGEGLSEEAAHTVMQFCHAAHASSVNAELRPEATVQALRLGASPDALNFFKAGEAYFVTPADLLENCSNLERVGTIP